MAYSSDDEAGVKRLTFKSAQEFREAFDFTPFGDTVPDMKDAMDLIHIQMLRGTVSLKHSTADGRRIVVEVDPIKADLPRH